MQGAEEQPNSTNKTKRCFGDGNAEGAGKGVMKGHVPEQVGSEGTLMGERR